jgi:D-serine deaminase-like pyridoxal phosphate-dependent protein
MPPTDTLPNAIRLSNYALPANVIAEIRTPALLIYADVLEANIAAMLRFLNGDPNRWRPHIKTVKLAYAMKQYVAHGIVQFKAANTLEVKALCDAGAHDVILAYPIVGANARRLRELAAQYRTVAISTLVETEAQLEVWRGSNVGLFIDINPGMNRTGIGQMDTDAILALAQSIVAAGLDFRGLHYYDGHIGSEPLSERNPIAQKGYDQLMRCVAMLQRAGLPVREVTTSGTRSYPAAMAYTPFASGANFVHRITPGTVAFCDTLTMAQLPADFGLRPAALVVASVVSHPKAQRFTCDAGHKAVSADMGVPTCAVIGHPEFTPASPSEEHLPVDVAEGYAVPNIGTVVYLVPKHVCPTVNLFDHALIVRGAMRGATSAKIEAMESVTARGREMPIG